MASFLDNILSAFTGKPAEKAAQQNAQLYRQYGTDAQSAINRGEQQAAEQYNQGISAYTPLSQLGSKYGAATSLQLDALGLGGQAGIDRARAAFQSSPGYDWARDQALQAVERSGVARGLGMSGNTLQALQDRGAQLANQEYGNWLDRLGSYVNPELGSTGAAASGTAQGYRSLGDLYNTNAQNRVNIFGNVAGGQAAANQQQAQAQMNASNQFWNSLLNLGGALGSAALGGKK